MKRGYDMIKREREKLTKLVGAFLTARGAVRTPRALYDYRLLTLAGPFLVSVGQGGGAIFGRFDDPKRAASVLPSFGFASLNTYSGKWNHHFNRCTAEQAFEIFKRDFEPPVVEVKP
jgi:hypothetical protein